MKSRIPLIVGCLLTTLLIGVRVGQSLPSGKPEQPARSTVSPFHSDGWQLVSGQQSGPAAMLQTELSVEESLRPGASPAESNGEGHGSTEGSAEPDIAYFPEVIVEAAGDSEHQLSDQPTSLMSGGVPVGLPALSKADAAVWNSQLKDLPPGQAEEILNLRQQLGSVAAESLGLSFPEMAGTAAPAPGLFPALAADNARPIPIEASSSQYSRVMHTNAANESPLAKRLRQAADRNYAENLANQKTVGFKRRQIVLLNVSVSDDSTDAAEADEPTRTTTESGVVTGAVSEAAQAPTVQWLTRLDLRPGEMTPTNNPLDLAISGQGWLKVERNGQLEFVRTGMLGFDAQGRLGIHTGAGLLPIVPAIQVPVEQQRLVIAESGEIYAETADGHQQLDTQFVAVDFRNASALKRTSVGTYIATDDSGPAVKTRPGFVRFLQAVLEESNVDIESESAETTRLKEIAQQMVR
ncbi:MAG: flagellar hook basal-body protein [Rhodopirellula sp.]|nr:flagellar hook basal-body protein [Rhodopirellula sp.]